MDNASFDISAIEMMQQRFKAVARRLPFIAGNEVVNFALDNFKRQGFLGATFQPWRPRKNPTAWGTKPKRNGRNILVDSGKLRRATRVAQADWNLVRIVNNMPYANAHNEGLQIGEIQHVKQHIRKVTTIAKVSSLNTHKTSSRKVYAGDVNVKGHTRRIDQKIPMRKFVGDSPYLRANISRAIAAQILKALK